MGSHVFLVALADGRVLYDNLKNRIHPIGSLKNDVTYSHFYDYFNCLQVCHSEICCWISSSDLYSFQPSWQQNKFAYTTKDNSYLEVLHHLENNILRVVARLYFVTCILFSFDKHCLNYPKVLKY